LLLNSWSLLLIAAGLRTLVLPFENVGTDRADDWKGSAFEEAISAHFESAGHDVVDLRTRNNRLVELGFVPGEPLSRATAIVLGKELNAERLVVGVFRTSTQRLEVEARVVDLEMGATLGIVADYASVDDLASLSNQLAKNLFRLEAHAPPPGFDDRAKRRERLSLSALEASADARLSADPDEQRRQLETALEHEPDYVEARLVLGRLLLDAGEPRDAIDMLVGAGEEAARHRGAYYDLGLAYLAVDEAESALQVFGALTSIEALEAASYNNQGVALMRLERFLPAVDAFLERLAGSPS
jgi:tetratricopeptide (TPR) repeat protein